MSEVRLDEVLARLPSGLPLPVGCWLVGRVASALAAQPRPVTPLEVRIREDGGVRVADPARDQLPFAYRAPEVIRGGASTPRSSVFTLGVLLIETVTGRAPFARGTDMETRIAVAEEEVPPLTGRVGQASRNLDAVLARALAKDPAKRTASTVELAEQLDAFLDEELFDVGTDELVTAVRAAFAGVDLWTAMRDPDSVVAPLPTSPSRSREGAGGRAAEGRAEPERPDVPAPPRPPPRPEPPPEPAVAYAEAELDLRPQGRRTSAPNKPRLDEEVVRLGDPLQEHGGAGITDASVTGVDVDEPSYRRPPAAAGVLDIDQGAFTKERHRPATMVDDAPPPEPGPNWVKRIAIALVVLLAAAIAYQYVIRPLLRG